jgi:O-Antigen ligase
MRLPKLKLSPPSTPRLAKRRRTVAFVAISACAGVIAVILSLYQVSLFPPSAHQRYLQRGAALGRAAVEVHPGHRLNTPQSFEGQSKRADLLANAMASAPILDRTAARMGLDRGQIAGKALLNEGVPEAFSEPDNERRAVEIVESEAPYELELQARPTIPVIEIYAEGPTQAGAEALVTASVEATNQYLVETAAREGAGPPQPVTVTQLGPPRGGPLESTAPKEIALLAFLVVFFVTFALLWTIAEARRGWLASAPRKPGGRARGAGIAERLQPIRSQLGDWPRTTRVLPWMVAAFIALIWLVPVNTIWLEMSLPIDLKLDRIALPLLVGAWLLALLVGGRHAPKVRLTKVHVAIGIFVAVAFLSVVLNSTELARNLEFGLAVKKLSLLGAIGIFFLIVASVVRPSEVRAFMTFMLILATIVAVGMLIEYRSGTNLFYEWSARILPSVFHTTTIATRYDEVGRREVLGTADVSLEAVAMLALALPIALTRLLERGTSRSRLGYLLVTLILLGAMVATYRKSALLAPIVVVAIMICFRPRQMVRLAPLGLIVLVVLPIIAPNALGSVIEQFQPHKLGVATVSDRVSDYDAIRPDVLSHLLFGRGFGSYEHSTYRTLDNDMLMRLVESGVIGLLAWLGMLIGLIAIAAPLIRGGDMRRGPPALAIAAGAGGFLVMSLLFDMMSFPQTPYIMVALAGLLAVLIKRPTPVPSPAPLQVAEPIASEPPPPAPVPVG